MPKNQENDKNQEGAIEKAAQAAVVKRDPADVSTYRILNRSEEDIAKAMDIFKYNLRGQKITERDLRRVKVPPQGITIWSIPSTEGDIHTEEITGLLVEYTTPRAYWDKPMDPNTLTPPNCSSPDGVMGTGDPGGPCYLCPFSKYGSDPREDSNGQACKEKRMLFILRPDGLLPIVVQAPSTSIRNVFNYTMGLANEEEVLFHNVYTQLTLEKVNAGGGIDYGKVNLKNVGRVSEEYHSKLESYRDGLANILGDQAVEVIPDDENETAENQGNEAAPPPEDELEPTQDESQAGAEKEPEPEPEPGKEEAVA